MAGELVALRLPPGPGYADALERVWASRDAALPLDQELSPQALAQVLEAFRPSALLDDNGQTSLPDGEPVARGTALVVATSGATALPKGVELAHAALEASARASLARIGASPGRWLCVLPLTHVAGVQVLVRARLASAPVVVHGRFDIARIDAEADIAFVSLVPTMLARLLDAGVDLARFEAILLGGGPAPEPLVERARLAGARVLVTYGLTETCGGCVYDGIPLDGVEARIDPDGRIALRGPVLMTGYRLRPDLTAEVLRDAWLRTADLGRVDGDGRLHILGRADDVIITGGEQVSAAIVAALLLEHPAVADAAVIGRADAEWGQRVAALVVPVDAAAPPTLADLRAFVRARAPIHHAPRALTIVNALPRTSLGKIDRRRLHDLARLQAKGPRSVVVEEAARRSRPLVSMISIFHERPGGVPQSLESMLSQDYENIEFLVVDDGSRDNTFGELQRFIDPRLDLRTQTNRGFTRSLRETIARARGELIAFHDAGDVSYPERVSKQVALAEETGAGVIGCYFRVREEGGWMRRGRRPQLPPNATQQLCKDNVLSHGGTLFRRSVYEQAGGYREFFLHSEDRDLWLRMSLLTDFAVVPEYLYERVRFKEGTDSDQTKKVIQVLYSTFAVQCLRMRIREGYDFVDRYEQAAAIFRRPSAEGAKRLWRLAIRSLRDGDLAEAAQLAELSRAERRTTRNTLLSRSIDLAERQAMARRALVAAARVRHKLWW